ncbi:MAG: hypothetical protein AVDCRST_MAG18-171 [uncultured Thermomicrobiales bacterium]|uniref:Uncharacterized protein n=1 Tax=uncultured Thermomicrobiales bacterium TaxID=1645740 RepID=A0A6J4UH66_9BACT|nr:MAG: hypothetical protein AVDCRST_MAG18-171 [uncultured Thermomicrobiales bacterium]
MPICPSRPPFDRASRTLLLTVMRCPSEIGPASIEAGPVPAAALDTSNNAEIVANN